MSSITRRGLTCPRSRLGDQARHRPEHAPTGRALLCLSWACPQFVMRFTLSQDILVLYGSLVVAEKPVGLNLTAPLQTARSCCGIESSATWSDPHESTMLWLRVIDSVADGRDHLATQLRAALMGTADTEVPGELPAVCLRSD